MAELTIGSSETEVKTIELPGLVADITEKYDRARQERRSTENKWLQAYRNYRGEYDAETLSRIEGSSSKVFVKITKMKVIAAFGQVIDVFFQNDKFPLTIQPTEKPLGVSEYAHFDLKGEEQEAEAAPDPYGHAGDGRTIAPGTQTHEILGGLADKYGSAPVKDGPAHKPDQPQIKPAELSAKQMERVIMDQLTESDAVNHVRRSLFEMTLLGTGVLKGPFNYVKKYNRWSEDGLYDPVERLIPKIEYVSCWNMYPDPDATTVENADYVIQRHLLTGSALRDLMNRPAFRKGAIKTALEYGPQQDREWFEHHLRDTSVDGDKRRFEVLEYWGTMSKAIAEEAGLKIPASFVQDADIDEVQINAWICNNEILRVVLNPFTPTRIPYLITPYELHPYQIWGIGVAENMDDSQSIMNGHARMAIDNLRLAGNVMLDIDETLLVPGQDFNIYAGKIWRRQGGQPGQSVYGIKLPDTSQQNMQIFDRFRQLADEQTGIPSYSHGSTGSTSTTRTASGMSMLMGAAALNIKTVIKNVDEYLIQPLGEALFAWNMQFNDDAPEIKGDLEVKARGSSSIMAKEVKSQRLMQLLQIVQNPNLAPFVRIHTLLADVADSLGIDVEKLINSPEEAAIAAAIMGQANGPNQGQGTPPAGEQPGLGTPAPSSAGPSAPDLSGRGNGTVGTGAPPMPGEASFSASA